MRITFFQVSAIFAIAGSFPAVIYAQIRQSRFWGMCGGANFGLE
jgi:hypothetical protein